MRSGLAARLVVTPQVQAISTMRKAAAAGFTTIPACQLTRAERISELGRILAAGALRLRDKSSSLSADRGESYLDYHSDQSCCDAPIHGRLQ
jgi:hypothetical protein